MNHPSQRLNRGRALSVLAEFFSQQSACKSDTTQDRYLRVHQHLHYFLNEGDMSRSLDLRENARLAESRRGGLGFFGALGLEGAIACLPRFLEPDWLLDSAADARAQVSLTGRLLTWLDRSGCLDPDLLGCAFYEAQAAVRAAQKRPPSTAARATEPKRARLTLIHGGLVEP